MITRVDLYDLVWSKPMTKVAEQFEVSGSYMARVCTVLNVPRPERGYWAKLAVGKAPARKPLPEARPGDQLSWSKDGALSSPPKPRLPLATERPTAVRLPKHAVHGLIRGARQHFETGRPGKEDDYLKPYKKLLVDVTSSKACLDKALGFANDLFNALERAGHRVLLAPPSEHLDRAAIDEREERTKKREHWEHRYPRLWSPHRPTVVYIGTVPVGLAVIEMSETVLMRYVGGRYIRDADYKAPKASRHYVDHTWTTTQCVPSGRLRLVAYAAYPRVSWSADWQETVKEASLKTSLPAIVKTIEGAAASLIEKLEEANRQAEIERLRWQAEQERWRREDDRRKVEQSIKDSREQLSKSSSIGPALWTSAAS